MTFSDQDLAAFLNGVAPDTLSEQIVAALEAGDTALEDRLMAMDGLAPVVREGFANVGPTAEAATVPERERSWHTPGLIAAGLAGAAIAVGLTQFLPDRGPDWRDEVAAYQVLYSAQTIAPLTASSDELSAQIALAESAVGYQGLEQVVEALEGLELLRTQLLQIDGAPLVQMVFADEKGVPIALCLLEGGDTDMASAPAFEAMQGLETASLESADHSWLLIGGTDADLIARNARAIAEVLTAS